MYWERAGSLSCIPPNSQKLLYSTRTYCQLRKGLRIKKLKISTKFTLEIHNAATREVQQSAALHQRDLCETFKQATVPITTTKISGSSGQAIGHGRWNDFNTTYWIWESAQMRQPGHDCRLARVGDSCKKVHKLPQYWCSYLRHAMMYYVTVHGLTTGVDGFDVSNLCVPDLLLHQNFLPM